MAGIGGDMEAVLAQMREDDRRRAELMEQGILQNQFADSRLELLPQLFRTVALMETFEKLVHPPLKEACAATTGVFCDFIGVCDGLLLALFVKHNSAVEEAMASYRGAARAPSNGAGGSAAKEKEEPPKEK